MVFLLASYIFVTLCAKRIVGKELSIEPIETTWRFANVICESSNFILMPGRSYRKADLVRILTPGETVWLNGWRMVTEDKPDSNGNIRFLKTDFIPSYNVMIRKYICEFEDGVFTVNDVPARSSTDQKRAAIYCQNSGGRLATINRQDVKTILDLVQDKVPHWSSDMTSADSIAKQCLAVKRISSGIKYYYEDCERNLRFVCLQDETTSGIFAPIVSKRYAPFKDFESEIARIASRTTIKTTVEDTTIALTTEAQTTTEVIETTASEETTTILYDGEDTSQVSDNDTNAETKDTLTRPTTTASTVNPTKEEREYYSMYFASNSSVEYHMTTPLPRNETTSTKDQASERVTVTRPVQTTGICNTSESTVYEQGTIKPSSVILSNMTSRQIPASPDSVKGLSNFTRPVDHFYESSFVSATSMADAFSTTSMNSGRSTFQSYQMSHIVESSLTTATDQTIEMDYSATRSSSKLLDRSQEGLLMSFKTSSEPLASTSPINVFSSVKPSALSSSHTQFQYSTSLYQRLKNDSIRGSAIWERSEEGLYETTVRVLETTSGSMKEGISRFIDVSKVVSDSRNKTDFATLGVITPTHTHVMGSVSVSDGQLDNQSTKAEENVSLFTSYIPFKASSFVNLSHSYNTKAHPRTAENQPVSQTQKYAITMDKGLTASFTLPSISNTRSSTDSMNTATNTKTMQNSGHSTVGLYDDISDYDYYYDYPSTVSMSPERVSSSPLHSTIISQPTQVINVSRSIPRDRNSTYRDSSYVTDTISPTKSTNIIMSDDIKIQKVDTESINRSSRENPKQVEAGPIWIAIGVIGVATVLSLCIAVILYKRRRKQKKISDLHTNGTQHPLVNQQEKDALGTAKTTSDHKDKQKNSDQSHDVFVDEAYDL